MKSHSDAVDIVLRIPTQSTYVLKLPTIRNEHKLFIGIDICINNLRTVEHYLIRLVYAISASDY